MMNRRLRKVMPAGLARAIVAMAIGLSLGMATRAAVADGSSDEVWLISTRRAPRTGRVTSAEKRIDYWRLQADRRWAPAASKDFLAHDRPLPTTVYIHGNRTGRNGAIRSGWQVYRRMIREAAGRPFRLVIWSWPSDRIRGRNRRDVRVKAHYSDVQGYYLANCLDRVNPEIPVCLIGYSFGARVITSALHLLAGGQVAGRRLPQRSEAPGGGARRRPIRAVLVAAALDADWLSPGRRNGLALSQVEAMLVTRNGCDPVLRWYPLMYRRGGPQALGYCGPTCGGHGEKIELLSVSGSVGRAHDWASYMRAPGVRRRLARFTFLDTPQPDAALEWPAFPVEPPATQ